MAPSTPRKPRGKRRRPATEPPSNMLNIEVALAPGPGGVSLLGGPVRPTVENIERFYADPTVMIRAAEALARLGFTVTAASRITLSVKAARSLYARVFKTRLSLFSQPLRLTEGAGTQAFYVPAEGAGFHIPEPLQGLVHGAYIQWPHLAFASPLPPRVTYHHLRVPGDVSLVLNAARVHREGTTGKGVRVAMVDSGFYTEHPYFRDRGYNMAVILAPGASDGARDGNGHGTAESANLFAVAPDVHFIGVKLDNERRPDLGASLAEGFKTAVDQSPDIITVSLGYDLVQRGGRKPLGALPNALTPLEAEIKAAVSAGITVIFSAGNGHVSFPGMMPEVVSAGGVYVDEHMERQASDYASAFESRIYPGRHVPDVCGLVGMASNNAAYIMLPLEPGSTVDESTATRPDEPDDTEKDDGWSVISGTSAAAPQIAGVCALLKQKNSSLSPAEIKSILERTARDVVKGHANPASNDGKAVKAGAGPDDATGHGLVDALAAWRQT